MIGPVVHRRVGVRSKATVWTLLATFAPAWKSLQTHPVPTAPPLQGIPKLLEEKLDAPFTSSLFCGLLSGYMV